MSNGGSTPAQQVQQTSSVTGPPQAIEGVLKSMSQDLSNYYFNNPNAPGYYPGSTVAGLTPQMQSAIGSMLGGVAPDPVLGAAGRSLTGTLGGQYLDIASNPYFQGALAAGFQPQTSQFMTSVLPGVTAQFEGAGRYGSGQQQAYTGLALDSLNQAQANAAAQASLGAYNQERSNMLTAAGLAPQIASTGANIQFQNIANALAAGQITQQQAQALIDADVARYNYNATAQPNYITTLAQQLQSIYPGATSSSTSSSSYAMPSYNPTSDILRGLLGGARLGLGALGNSTPGGVIANLAGGRF